MSARSVVAWLFFGLPGALSAWAVWLLIRFERGLDAYTTEKAKNLATKQDIESITRAVEGVKNEFAKENERLRAALQKSVQVHRVQAELEIDAYRDVWECLTELVAAAEPLRQGILTVRPADPKAADAERLRNIARADDAYAAFIKTFFKLKPFYPLPIYQQLEAVRMAAVAEPAHRNFGHEEGESLAYYERGEQLGRALDSAVEAACEAIRSRLAQLTTAGDDEAKRVRGS